MDYTKIEKEIEALKERNKRVETDKRWEKSLTRTLFITTTTYLIATIWLYFIKENNIFLKAVIPTGGYILSTLSIPVLKKIWIKATSKSL